MSDTHDALNRKVGAGPKEKITAAAPSVAAKIRSLARDSVVPISAFLAFFLGLAFAASSAPGSSDWERAEASFTFATLVAVIAGWVTGLIARQQATKPITIVITNGPGGQRQALPFHPPRVQLSRSELWGILRAYNRGAPFKTVEQEGVYLQLNEVAEGKLNTIQVPLEDHTFRVMAAEAQGLKEPPDARVFVFVRCGERYSPPSTGQSAVDQSWETITLADELGPGDLRAAVASVRAAIRQARASHCTLLISGPVTLGVALGQALGHESVAIDYVQLSQPTKSFEVWVTNRDNL